MLRTGGCLRREGEPGFPIKIVTPALETAVAGGSQSLPWLDLEGNTPDQNRGLADPKTKRTLPLAPPSSAPL